MPLTRRELCSAFPVALLPALLSVEDPSARQSSLPSTMYVFENLPVRTANNAQFRDVLKGRLATVESSATTLVNEISVSKAIENLEAAKQRNDTPVTEVSSGNVVTPTAAKNPSTSKTLSQSSPPISHSLPISPSRSSTLDRPGRPSSSLPPLPGSDVPECKRRCCFSPVRPAQSNTQHS